MAKLLAILMVLGLGCGDDVSSTGGAGGSGGSGGMAGSGGSGGSGGTGGTGGMAGTGGSGGIDAPMTIDAPTDGMGGDDASALACTNYCQCMVTGNCQGSANGFNNLVTCEAACVLLSSSRVACRANECNQAQDSGDVQCQHAVGMGAGIPAECR